MILENKQYIKRYCKIKEDKDALQEVVYGAQLTTINPSHPHATEDRIKPHLAKLVKDFVKDYKGSRNWTCRS